MIGLGTGCSGEQALIVVPAAVPTAPGVYFLLDEPGQVLYVGKAADLHRRLGDHTRSRRWAAVAGIGWEVLNSEAEAIAREADILAALRPPWNKAHVDDYFSYVTITDRGLVVGRSGDYGCFPHLGKGALSEPGRACIDGFEALNRIVKTTRPERRLIHEFLSGQSDRLLRSKLELDQPHIAHGVRRDRIFAKGFFDAGPKAMRTLRLRHGARGLVSPEQFVAWITEEVTTIAGNGPRRCDSEKGSGSAGVAEDTVLGPLSRRSGREAVL